MHQPFPNLLRLRMHRLFLTLLRLKIQRFCLNTWSRMGLTGLLPPAKTCLRRIKRLTTFESRAIRAQAGTMSARWPILVTTVSIDLVWRLLKVCGTCRQKMAHRLTL
jgi:hypothetical protein